MSAVDALSLGALIWVSVVALIAGFVHGVIGFGYPLVAMPLLTIVLDLKSAILVAIIPTALLAVASMFYGGSLRQSVGRFWFMPLCMMVGTYSGTTLLIGADSRPFILLLAISLLLYLNIDRFGRHRLAVLTRYPRISGAIFALVAGWFEATANVAGPILLIYFMLIGLDPKALVQTLNFCWIGGKLMQIGTWTVAGGISATFWLSTVPFALVALLTLASGHAHQSAYPASKLSALAAPLSMADGFCVAGAIHLCGLGLRGCLNHALR